MDNEYLKECIRQSFKDVQDPGEAMIPPNGYDWEVEGLMSKNWSTWLDIPPEVIAYNSGCLPFLSPQGYKFILPAFMIYALDNPGEYVKDSVIYSLMLPNKLKYSDRFERFHARSSHFNQKQVNSIVLFLRYEEYINSQSKYKEATKALEDYWGERYFEVVEDN